MFSYIWNIVNVKVMLLHVVRFIISLSIKSYPLSAARFHIDIVFFCFCIFASFLFIPFQYPRCIYISEVKTRPLSRWKKSTFDHAMELWLLHLPVLCALKLIYNVLQETILQKMLCHCTLANFKTTVVYRCFNLVNR